MVMPEEAFNYYKTRHPEMNPLIYKSLEAKVSASITDALYENQKDLAQYKGDMLQANYNLVTEAAVAQVCPYAEDIRVDLSSEINNGKGSVTFTVGGVELSTSFTKPENMLVQAMETADLQLETAELGL